MNNFILRFIIVGIIFCFVARARGQIGCTDCLHNCLKNACGLDPECAFHFPEDNLTARVMAYVSPGTVIHNFTINYFMKFENSAGPYAKPYSHPLSTYFEFGNNVKKFSRLIAHFRGDTTPIPTNKWIQVTQIYIGSTGFSKLWINGYAVHNQTTNWIGPIYPDGFFILGQRLKKYGSVIKFNPALRFSGVISRLSIWDVLLSEEHLGIVLSARTNYPPDLPEPNVISNFRPDGGAKALDSSSDMCYISTAPRIACCT